MSCEIKLSGRFYVDGYNSFCGAYGVKVEKADIGYVEGVKIDGRAKVTGEVAKVKTCEPPFDTLSLLERAKVENDNENIPPKFLKDLKLKLEAEEKLTLPSGVYYLEEIKLSGRSSLSFEGPSTVFVDGDVKVEGKAVLNASEIPWNLRLVSTEDVKVEGSGKVYGLLMTLDEVKVEGQGEIFGCVLSEEFKGEGRGKVHCDSVLALNEVKVYPSEVTLNVGETYQLSARAYDVRSRELECAPFSWRSENPQIAEVDQTGLVKAISKGETYVIASVLGIEGKAKVIVTPLVQRCVIKPHIEPLPPPLIKPFYQEFSIDPRLNCVNPGERYQDKGLKVLLEPGIYDVVIKGGVFSWWTYGPWGWRSVVIVGEYLPSLFWIGNLGLPLFVDSTKAEEYWKGYSESFHVSMTDYVYFYFLDNPCWDNGGMMYMAIQNSPDYPKEVTVDSQSDCCPMFVKHYFEPGTYKVTIKEGAFKSTGLTMWEIWTVERGLGLPGPWIVAVDILVGSTGQILSLGDIFKHFGSYEEAINFWRGKHITFTQRDGGYVYFYVPDDQKRCEGNIWKIVLTVEKIDY